MDERSPLENEIRRRIAAAGPMPVGEYMALCLADRDHGYYMTRDPFGRQGDFVTAPEVSQMFGELIGLWMAATWKQMGEPPNVRIVELGPGRGTMMNDALRAIQVVPEFRDAIVVHLVEISPALQARQEQTLSSQSVPLFWHASLNEVPSGPVIILANEFFDALPVNQAVKVNGSSDGAWHERCVGVDHSGQFVFTVGGEPLPLFERLLPQAVRAAAPDAIFEWRPDAVAMDVARRVTASRGAALIIDYGHAESATGETLQAVGNHAYANPLTEPGEIDLTAHVDFEALSRAGDAMGAKIYGPITQAELLGRLGIEGRAAALKANSSRNARADVESALNRLTGYSRTGMGQMFKAMTFVHPELGVPAGFET